MCLGACVKGSGEKKKVFNFKTILGTYNALGIYWELSTQSEIDGNNSFNRGYRAGTQKNKIILFLVFYFEKGSQIFQIGLKLTM